MKRAAALLAVLVTLEVCQLGVSTEAGTTGGLSGQVHDEKGAPVSGALLKVVSASQTAVVTTDGGGHYTFLSLAPDTYTLTAAKRGHADVAYSGVVIFADQTRVLIVKMPHALKEIAKVITAAQGSLVNAGTTVDVYAVNEATATQLQTLGGGNNLNSAYSAIYAQPGVQGLPGNYGFGQTFYIHGSLYGQVGYEFDGIPVNRAFDNYNASSLSNLGVISTEVYTSGGPAAAPSATLGGYINQVIKSGTFPGYATVDAGIGSRAFYHMLALEAGGATPDRNLSWYVGLRGDNLIPDQLNAENGSNLAPDGDNPYGVHGVKVNVTLWPLEEFGVAAAPGPWSTCLGNGIPPKGSSTFSPRVAKHFFGTSSFGSCEVYGPVYGALTSALGGNDLSDRENVLNFHIGVPHRFDAGRDDIQLLFDNFYYQTTSFDNVSANGGLAFTENAFAIAGGRSGLGLYNTFLNNFYKVPPSQQPINYLKPAQMPQYPGICAYINFIALFGGSNPCPSSGFSPMPYADAFQVIGTTFGQPAVGATKIVAPYFFPSSPVDRQFGSGFSPYQSSNTGNNGSIGKVQYTKNFSPNAYVRFFGYAFYSDWLQNDPNYGSAPFLTGAGTAADYELNTHTVGGGFQFADQLTAQNLLTVTSNYVTAATERSNNLQYLFTPNGTPIATLMSANGTCYSGEVNDPNGGTAAAPRVDGSYPLQLPIGSPVSCLSALAGEPIGPVVDNKLPAPVGEAAAAGAIWKLTQNIEPDVNKNTVGPRFLNIAIQDEFRPTDRWDVNAGLRVESYGYALGNVGSPEQAFWFKVINQTVCVDPDGLQQVAASDFTAATGGGVLPSAYPDFYTTLPGQPCLKDPLTGDRLYHPGQHDIPQISLGSTGTLTDRTLSPRVGFTFTASPSSVIRFAYGRYTQPSITGTEQVLTYEDGYQMARSLYSSAFYNLGLASITHNNPIQFSNSWDASFEQRLRGTNWSFKVSPYYRYTTGQSVLVPLPGGIASSFNSADERAAGLELAVQEGDPSRNGWSGQLSYTYTFAQEKYALIDGSNVVAAEVSNLKSFYGLTKNGGGAPCYDPKTGPVKVCAKDARAIINPYYDLLPNDKTFAALASNFPVTGWYPVYASYFPYGLGGGDPFAEVSPNLFASFLSYKHNKFQGTLTANLWEGAQYGSPTDILGLDPRFCYWNQSIAAVMPGSQKADYQTCGARVAIPNPFTGQFEAIGAFREPWQLNLGFQFAYELSPRITLTVAIANIFNACFGGSAEPWTAAYPPNSLDCAYTPNASYLGWSRGEIWNTAGAGYFYGNNPHAAVNGTAGYPKLFDQAYAPGPVQVASPFQAFIQAHVKL